MKIGVGRQGGAAEDVSGYDSVELLDIMEQQNQQQPRQQQSRQQQPRQHQQQQVSSNPFGDDDDDLEQQHNHNSFTIDDDDDDGNDAGNDEANTTASTSTSTSTSAAATRVGPGRRLASHRTRERGLGRARGQARSQARSQAQRSHSRRVGAGVGVGVREEAETSSSSSESDSSCSDSDSDSDSDNGSSSEEENDDQDQNEDESRLSSGSDSEETNSDSDSDSDTSVEVSRKKKSTRLRNGRKNGKADDRSNTNGSTRSGMAFGSGHANGNGNGPRSRSKLGSSMQQLLSRSRKNSDRISSRSLASGKSNASSNSNSSRSVNTNTHQTRTSTSSRPSTSTSSSPQRNQVMVGDVRTPPPSSFHSKMSAKLNTSIKHLPKFTIGNKKKDGGGKHQRLAQDDDDDDDANANDNNNFDGTTPIATNQKRRTNTEQVVNASDLPYPEAATHTHRSPAPVPIPHRDTPRRGPHPNPHGSIPAPGQTSRPTNRSSPATPHRRVPDPRAVAEAAHARSRSRVRNGRILDPANFPLEQYTDAEYGIQDHQRQPNNDYMQSYSSANPNSIDYEPQALRKMNPQDVESAETKRNSEKMERMIIFWGIVSAISIMLIIMVSTVLSYRAHIHVRPPPHDIVDICSMKSIATSKGHDECEKVCEEASCCMASQDASCFEEQEEVCAMYAPCGTMLLHRNDVSVPPAAIDIGSKCSDTSLATETGYLQCKNACHPGLCCLPPLLQSMMYGDGDVDGTGSGSGGNSAMQSSLFKPSSCLSTHTNICSHYTPCTSLEEVHDVHGSAVELVKMKCTIQNIQFAEGRRDCENICQTRSCCFADSIKRNCRDDNLTWCDNFSTCNYLLTLPDNSSSNTSTNQSGNGNGNGNGKTLVDKCKDPRLISKEDMEKCVTICKPAEKCCGYFTDSKCKSDEQVDCNYFNFCENVVTLQMFPPLEGGGGYGHGSPIDELPLTEDDILIEIQPPAGGHGSNRPTPAQVGKSCQDPSSEACQRNCLQFHCCFADDFDAISCHASSYCDQYQVCKQVFADVLSSPHGDSGSWVSTDSDFEKYYYEKTATADEICSMDNLLVNGGLKQCKDVCVGKLCCFRENECENRSCENYQACSFLTSDLLLGEDSNGAAVFDIGSACSADEALLTKKGRSDCHKICDSRHCCRDNSCVSSSTDFCHGHSACSFVDRDKDYYPLPKVNMNVLCNVQMTSNWGEDKLPFYGEQCKEVCEPAKCCHDKTCEHIENFCAHYVACNNIWNLIDDSGSSGAKEMSLESDSEDEEPSESFSEDEDEKIPESNSEDQEVPESDSEDQEDEEIPESHSEDQEAPESDSEDQEDEEIPESHSEDQEAPESHSKDQEDEVSESAEYEMFEYEISLLESDCADSNSDTTTCKNTCDYYACCWGKDNCFADNEDNCSRAIILCSAVGYFVS